ncbi:PTS sugar transporter subunit IIA [Ignavigranum ruoffiae]|uniref:PTS sugar transporter subunit IIA n=1 Tax=Ignavigranum ruoffiae TaxID=89093 RepID=UPI00205AA332|nr:PTS sugar transporter subunit IIA [Ignavigranum ruoffiae]UPQ86612.1 PTS sugar transporter subunit IIA [Ignavigranum ruoffiae]
MFEIIIVTHGTLSDGFKDAVNTIIGQSKNIKTINLLSGKSIENLKDKILKTVEEADNETNEETGVIIFTDLVSASPYNQSILAIKEVDLNFQDKVYVVGGVNLPMVLEAVNHQILGTNIHETIDSITSQGKESIGYWNINQLDFNLEDEDEF